MLKTMLPVALVVATLVAGPAQAWERKVTVDTPRGTYTGTAEVYCFDGACYRDSELTGVNGATLQKNGMCTLTEPGVWSCQSTAIGPNGGVRHRSSTITAN